MEPSKVYYTDFRCPVGTSLLEKLRRVCIAAGIKDIDMDGRFVAIKMHFGEPGNLTFLQGCAASLVGQDVLVDTKALEAEPITVAGSTAAALGLTFVFVLPAAVLIAGAVVVLLRRRR